VRRDDAIGERAVQHGGAMTDLYEAALACLRCADPASKVALTREAAANWKAGRLAVPPLGTAAEAVEIPQPGRPERPRLVAPRDVARRRLGSPGGRAALVHAVAHIELNAIDLAWDAVYRFRAFPPAYVDDWVGVAEDEARHYTLLAGRLAELGHAYGDFDAHNGLWEMAVKTADDPLRRMALVPRVLEARGLDVTPGMIERLRAVGDHETVAILELILREEVAHVAAGSRWFAWCCAGRGLAPEPTFRGLLAEVSPGLLRGPLNHAARIAAGFTARELASYDPVTTAEAVP